MRKPDFNDFTKPLGRGLKNARLARLRGEALYCLAAKRSARPTVLMSLDLLRHFCIPLSNHESRAAARRPQKRFRRLRYFHLRVNLRDLDNKRLKSLMCRRFIALKRERLFLAVLRGRRLGIECKRGSKRVFKRIKDLELRAL